jgi:hypothetical protein
MAGGTGRAKDATQPAADGGHGALSHGEHSWLQRAPDTVSSAVGACPEDAHAKATAGKPADRTARQPNKTDRRRTRFTIAR